MNYMKRKALGHKCEVSIIAGAVGFAATAAAVSTVGAGVMAAGSLLGIKEAKQVGGLMMAGGGIASGAAGLGMVGGVAGATTTLGTLSAGASLVGGALQGVGILTGNNKLSNIGGLINAGGMLGSSFDSGMLSGDAGASTAKTGSSGSMSGYSIPSDSPINLGNSTKTMDGAYRASTASGTFGNQAQSAVDSFMAKIDKYDRLINMAGGALKTMNENKAANDRLAFEREKFATESALYKQAHTAAAIPGQIGVSAPATQRVVQQVNPNNRLGLISTGPQATGVFA